MPLSKNEQPRIFIVEDDLDIATATRETLEELGYEVSGMSPDADRALVEVREAPPDLALVDIGLAGSMDGITLAARIRSELGVAIVFMTAHGDEDTVARAKEVAPFGYLLKPFSGRALAAAIENRASQGPRRSGATGERALALGHPGEHRRRRRRDRRQRSGEVHEQGGRRSHRMELGRGARSAGWAGNSPCSRAAGRCCAHRA